MVTPFAAEKSGTWSSVNRVSGAVAFCVYEWVYRHMSVHRVSIRPQATRPAAHAHKFVALPQSQTDTTVVVSTIATHPTIYTVSTWLVVAKPRCIMRNFRCRCRDVHIHTHTCCIASIIRRQHITEHTCLNYTEDHSKAPCVHVRHG